MWAATAVTAATLFALCMSCGAQCYTDPNTGRQVCPGDIYQYQVPSAKPTYADLKVVVGDKDNGTSIGSGTPIYRTPDGGTAIATNWHVVEDRRSDSAVTVSGPHGTAKATVVGGDEEADVAIIVIREPWRYVEMADRENPGATFQTRGYRGGRSFSVYNGKVTATTKSGYFISCSSYSGMSGGGVFQNGKYVGILWGGDRTFTAVTRVGFVRRVIDRLFGEKNTAAPPAPTLAPQPTHQGSFPVNRPCVRCACSETLKAHHDTIVSLVEQMNSVDGRISKIASDVTANQGDLQLVAGSIGKINEAISSLKNNHDASQNAQVIVELNQRVEQLVLEVAELREGTPVSWDIRSVP